jgi:Asp-tRNA(Asn)/Glu-tRNA(Gln) amidotransferase A subunit family amidase
VSQGSLAHLSASDALRRLKARDISVADLARACLDRIRRHDPSIQAWVHLDEPLALRCADELDRALAAGRPPGPLFGIPVGIKDVFNTADMPTQMGSPIWARFQPGNDARVVHALRMAGALLLGKTATAEFAVHAPGPTRNPHHPGHLPGTSSSGSAAAVAASMVPLALGTQTAGSIIRPASYCGVFGFKPSFGTIPRTGMLKTTDSLDTVGGLARTIDDLGLLFDVIRVHGPDYPISHRELLHPSRRHPADRPWSVALVRGPKWDCAEPYAQQALCAWADDLRRHRSVCVKDISLLDGVSAAHDVHGTIYDYTLAYYFREEFKKHTLVSRIMYETIIRGARVTASQYREALERQCQLARGMEALFDGGIDVVLSLSTGGVALTHRDQMDRPDNCLIWTLCGMPALSLPVFQGPDRLPFGAQIAARRYSDYMLLDFARHVKTLGLLPEAPNPVPPLD